jgi:hypothetical protein
MRARSIALLGAGLALAGCHLARGAGVPTPIPVGRPEFTAGEPEGYWIWQDRAGWHLRTTSDMPHHFHGNVETVDGIMSDFRPVGPIPPTSLAAGTRRIEFDWNGRGGEVGFDWRVSSGCNRFEIYIDGTTRPLRVFLGGPGDSPYRVPFALCR